MLWGVFLSSEDFLSEYKANISKAIYNGVHLECLISIDWDILSMQSLRMQWKILTFETGNGIVKTGANGNASQYSIQSRPVIFAPFNNKSMAYDMMRSLSLSLNNAIKLKLIQLITNQFIIWG